MILSIIKILKVIKMFFSGKNFYKQDKLIIGLRGVF